MSSNSSGPNNTAANSAPGNNPNDSIIPKSLMDSLKDAFAVQASTTVKLLQVTAVDPQSLPNVDIISAIGIRSSSIAGTLAICFPAPTFLGVLNKMLGENYAEITQENADAAGELMNIIYASARVKINQSGHDFAPAIPTTTRGAALQISHSGSKKVIRVDCSCDYGPFYLEIGVRRVTG